MTDLDDRAALESGDPSGALRAVEETVQQWRTAVERASDAGALPTRHGISSIVWCGMGGSGIAGDALEAIATLAGSLPVVVTRGYDVPAYVGPNTLAIMSSYSGDTEETLSCFEQALARKARIVAFTTGGKLGEQAAERGIATIAPVEGLQPRFAFASILVPALVVVDRLGLVPGIADQLAEAEQILEGRVAALRANVESGNNEAKVIAEELSSLVPWVWGQQGILGVAANRWHAQFNENAKVPSFWSVLPELDHNELAPFDPGHRIMSDLAVVLLRSEAETPKMRARIEATLEEARPRVGRVIETWTVGQSPLAQLVGLVALGDFTSVYLALRRGVDPMAIHAITALKQRLS